MEYKVDKAKRRENRFCTKIRSVMTLTFNLEI